MKVEDVPFERREIALWPINRRVNTLANNLLLEGLGTSLLMACDQTPAV